MMSQNETAIELGFDPHRFQTDPELRAAYNAGFSHVKRQHLKKRKKMALIDENATMLIANDKTFFGHNPDVDPQAAINKMVIFLRDASAIRSIAFGRSESDTQLTDFFEDEDEDNEEFDDGYYDPGEDGNAGAAACC